MTDQQAPAAVPRSDDLANAGIEPDASGQTGTQQTGTQQTGTLHTDTLHTDAEGADARNTDTDQSDTVETHGHTEWAKSVSAPVRGFLRTESGSSGVLLAAIVAALVWANISIGSYDTVWHTELSFRLGDMHVVRDLHDWVGSGLMTLFFLVVGLEARREFDLGDLRDHTRFALPATAGVVGMIVPVLAFLAFTHGTAGAHGWGVAMSTDTALALGLLSLVGRRVPDRIRAFLLTLFIVDDVVALVVIALVYSDTIRMVPLLVGVVAFGVLVALRNRIDVDLLYPTVGLVCWLGMLGSGVDPVIVGLAVGLITPAFTPARSSLEQATGLFRLFREQPTSELARTATVGLRDSLSPNERLQNRLHPWTGFVIVPVFALANAGIQLHPSFLMHAYTTPVTLGIMVGYVLGKPVAILATTSVITRLSGGRIRPPVGWAAVTGSGTIAGVGFTVAVLIAGLAFTGRTLDEAKLGILSAAILATVLTWLVFRVTQLLPARIRIRALLGTSEALTDLAVPVDPDRDHVRGPETASVTVVEYGDFECPFCGQAEPAVNALLSNVDVRYVWRQLPLRDVHPRAQIAAEASEAAAVQGAFWSMHDLLMTHQDALKPADLARYAEQLGLDVDRFHRTLVKHGKATRVALDVESAERSGVSGTPTFFVNGRRYYGAFDVAGLKTAVKMAHVEQKLTPTT